MLHGVSADLGLKAGSTTCECEWGDKVLLHVGREAVSQPCMYVGLVGGNFRRKGGAICVGCIIFGKRSGCYFIVRWFASGRDSEY